jgi:hypothetical protein
MKVHNDSIYLHLLQLYTQGDVQLQHKILNPKRSDDHKLYLMA